MKELINPVEVTVDNHMININFNNQFDERLCERSLELYSLYVDDVYRIVYQHVGFPRRNGLAWRIQQQVDKITRDYIHREGDFLFVLNEVSGGEDE